MQPGPPPFLRSQSLKIRTLTQFLSTGINAFPVGNIACASPDFYGFKSPVTQWEEEDYNDRYERYAENDREYEILDLEKMWLEEVNRLDPPKPDQKSWRFSPEDDRGHRSWSSWEELVPLEYFEVPGKYVEFDPSKHDYGYPHLERNWLPNYRNPEIGDIVRVFVSGTKAVGGDRISTPAEVALPEHYKLLHRNCYSGEKEPVANTPSYDEFMRRHDMDPFEAVRSTHYRIRPEWE